MPVKKPLPEDCPERIAPPPYLPLSWYGGSKPVAMFDSNRTRVKVPCAPTIAMAPPPIAMLFRSVQSVISCGRVGVVRFDDEEYDDDEFSSVMAERKR